VTVKDVEVSTPVKGVLIIELTTDTGFWLVTSELPERIIMARSYYALVVCRILIEEQEGPNQRIRPKVEQSATTKLWIEDSVCLRDICAKFASVIEESMLATNSVCQSLR
jgi:hypothetical protein